jgi:hypothetical protein
MKDYYELVRNLTTKEKISVKPQRSYWILIQVLKAMLNLPLLGNLLRRSFVLVSFYLELQRPYYDATATMLKLLEQILLAPYYQHPKRKNYWWYFMRMAISILQERQMTALEVNPSLENKLILLGFDHYNPRADVKNPLIAHCFLAYSLWLFERAKVSEAIDFAKIAGNCNPDWGYPEYLVGWYSLFADGKESLEYFQKAVDKNWSFLHRINNDRMCQRHKNLIKQLNNHLVVKKIS